MFLFREIDLTTYLRISGLGCRSGVLLVQIFDFEFWHFGNASLCILVYTLPYPGRITSSSIVMSMCINVFIPEIDLATYLRISGLGCCYGSLLIRIFDFCDLSLVQHSLVEPRHPRFQLRENMGLGSASRAIVNPFH